MIPDELRNRINNRIATSEEQRTERTDLLHDGSWEKWRTEVHIEGEIGPVTAAAAVHGLGQGKDTTAALPIAEK